MINNLDEIKEAKDGIPESWETKANNFINSAELWIEAVKSGDLVDCADKVEKKSAAYLELTKEESVYIEEHNFDKEDLK